MRSIPSIQSFPHKNSQFLVYTQLHLRILFYTCVKFRFAFHSIKYSRLHLYCQLQTVQSGTYIQSVSIITTCFTHTFRSTHAFYSLYSVFSTQKQSVSCLHTVTHTHFVLPMRSAFALQSMLSNTVDSIYIVSYKQYCLILTYSQCQSLQLASHTHSVLLMRSIPSIQTFPHKNSQFLVYTQLHTRILFCPCVQLSFCSLCCQIQSTPSILSATNCTVWYLHTVSFNHYNLLHTHILFYSCVLFPLFSLFHTKTVSFLFTLSYTHAFSSAHAFNFRFAVYAVKYSRLHLYCQLQTVQSDTYIQSVSIITTCFTHTFCSTHAFYSLYSVFSTQKQSVSCLYTATHTHSVLPMRSIPSIQSFPHKNSQFLVYTQLHTRILFCPCVNFRFAFHSVKYSRLHLYCQLQTVQSGTYIQSVSIITTCYTQLFCSTHAFYSIYIVLFLINSYLLVCTLL